MHPSLPLRHYSMLPEVTSQFSDHHAIAHCKNSFSLVFWRYLLARFDRSIAIFCWPQDVGDARATLYMNCGLVAASMMGRRTNTLFAPMMIGRSPAASLTRTVRCLGLVLHCRFTAR